MTALDKSLLKDVYASVVFLTRFPAPGWPAAAERPLSSGMWAFPLAGVPVATVGGAVYILCDLLELPVAVAALFAVLALIVATGGLHEDGLADLADGIWGGSTPDRRLEIMSDSRIGAYGAIALIVSVAGRAAAIAAIGDPAFVLGALVAACAVSRAMMPMAMVSSTSTKSPAAQIQKPTITTNPQPTTTILAKSPGFLNTESIGSSTMAAKAASARMGRTGRSGAATPTHRA